MPTPQHYVAAHTAGYTGFRDMIVEAAKEWLQVHPGSHSTKDLTEALWPSRQAVGHDIEIRKRMVDALLKAADRELRGWATRGAVQGKVYGHAKRPWLWAKPERETNTEVPNPAPGKEASVQNLCDWIGLTPAGQFMVLRDREMIAAAILLNAHVTLK